MSLTGKPDGALQKMGIVFADILVDLYGVIGVQATLAEHNTSRIRQQMDISFLDYMTDALANSSLRKYAPTAWECPFHSQDQNYH